MAGRKTHQPAPEAIREGDPSSLWRRELGMRCVSLAARQNTWKLSTRHWNPHLMFLFPRIFSNVSVWFAVGCRPNKKDELAKKGCVWYQASKDPSEYTQVGQSEHRATIPVCDLFKWKQIADWHSKSNCAAATDRETDRQMVRRSRMTSADGVLRSSWSNMSMCYGVKVETHSRHRLLSKFQCLSVFKVYFEIKATHNVAFKVGWPDNCKVGNIGRSEWRSLLETSVKTGPKIQ